MTDTGSTYSYNAAKYGALFYAPGSKISLTNVQMTDNYCDEGCVIYNKAGSKGQVSIISSTLQRLVAKSTAAVAYIEDSSTTSTGTAKLTITNSNILDNSCGTGKSGILYLV